MVLEQHQLLTRCRSRWIPRHKTAAASAGAAQPTTKMAASSIPRTRCAFHAATWIHDSTTSALTANAVGTASHSSKRRANCAIATHTQMSNATQANFTAGDGNQNAPSASASAIVQGTRSSASNHRTSTGPSTSVRTTKSESLPPAKARNASSTAIGARTLRVEVDVANDAGDLMAGSYAEIEITLARDARPVVVPGAALLVRAEGARVATIDAQNVLRYVQVVVARDLGSEVEIAECLQGDERVVVNMADELPEGTTVDPIALPAPAPAPAPAAPREPQPASKVSSPSHP